METNVGWRRPHGTPRPPDWTALKQSLLAVNFLEAKFIIRLSTKITPNLGEFQQTKCLVGLAEDRGECVQCLYWRVIFVEHWLANAVFFFFFFLVLHHLRRFVLRLNVQSLK